MSIHTDPFREALESAVEDALAKVPQEVVTAVWNACDDERGRLLDENRELRAQLTAADSFRAEVAEVMAAFDRGQVFVVGLSTRLRVALERPALNHRKGDNDDRD